MPQQVGDPININAFMRQFHQLERDLALFDADVGGELWWDSVRFEVCYFLFDCLTGLTYSSAHRPIVPARKLGIARRTVQREALLAKALLSRRDLLVIRAPRSISEGRRHDVVLDPIVTPFASRSLIVDTLPRRYHLPDCDPARSKAADPSSLSGIVHLLLDAFGIDVEQARPLDALIRRIRAEYRCHVEAYQRLFDRMRPTAVLLVQNGIEKALFHVANIRNVPTIEAQHGLIGFGHPAYSYPRGLDYARQTGMPDLFLTFSPFWSVSGYYPAGRHAVVGTNHFATGIAPIATPVGAIMIICADIYHHELIDVCRTIAQALPKRKIIYKLHPNQRHGEPAIGAALADLPNIVVGSASTPAVQWMDDVSHVVAIQSTVVYEALQHGRRICILPRHDYHIHSDIFDNQLVSVPDDASSLIEALSVPAAGASGPTFFAPFDPAEASRLVEATLAGNDSGPVAAS